MCQLVVPFLKIRSMYICDCKFINLFRILIKDESYKACCVWSRLYSPDRVNKIPLDRTNRSMSFSKHILSLGLRPGQKQDAVTYLLTWSHVTDRAKRPNSFTSSVPYVMCASVCSTTTAKPLDRFLRYFDCIFLFLGQTNLLYGFLNFLLLTPNKLK